MPMAPRPSSPTISYLPAFVTVSICLVSAEFGWRLRKNPENSLGQTAPSGWSMGLSYRNPNRAQRTRVRRHPDTHFRQYPADFREVNATAVPVFRTGYGRAAANRA